MSSKPAAGICSRCGRCASAADTVTLTRFCYVRPGGPSSAPSVVPSSSPTTGRCMQTMLEKLKNTMCFLITIIETR
ncbi:hypothetical protein MUK42_17380 [Musa troglodytarum]|nr:hypothetical protein MUK42_17380 [Musa troglodytarum]